MPTPNQEWEEYLSSAYSLAFKEFYRTDLYNALKDILDQAESVCETRFPGDDFACIHRWIDALMAVNSAECCFMYERGHQDCVGLLKRLGAL